MMNAALYQGVWSSSRITQLCAALARRYPFITRHTIGRSVMGKPISALILGSGRHRVLFHGAHHANEWITAPLLLRFVCALSAAYQAGGSIGGERACELLSNATLAVIPAVNPDGIDLVTGALRHGVYYQHAKTISACFPGLSFPSDWKSNIAGVDLNLQYPAGWEQAREIKAAQGVTQPAPRDYVGTEPLIAPEARALYAFTEGFSPALTLSYHTQGREIYWQYLDYAPQCSQAIAKELAARSGYVVADVPFASGFAGYKDWFLQAFRRPGFTIEAGSGINPLPLTQLPKIYAENLGIFVYSMHPFVV